MAPKAPKPTKKGSEAPAPPNPDEELGLAAPFTDEAAVAYTAAAGPLFEDPKGTELPVELAAAVASWKRPAEFLGHLIGQDGALGAGAPHIVDASAAAAMDRSAGSRALAHPVVPGVPEGVAPVAWVTSVIQVVAHNAPKLAAGCYLWELIYPKGSDGLPTISLTGRYGVRLFDHSRWRLVEVDDRMPLDGQGRPLLPVSADPLELWPLILAKAVYKLSAAAPPPSSSSGCDQAALLRLTGWMAETVPILPSLPKSTACGLLSSMLARQGAAIVAVSLPPAGDAAADSLLAERGLVRPAVLTVCEVRQVDGALEAHGVNGGSGADGNQGAKGAAVARRFVRLQSELMSWRGPFCDMDEASWSAALAAELNWKRMQRLRRMAAGERLHDFWIDEGELLQTFSSPAPVPSRPNRTHHPCARLVHRPFSHAHPHPPPHPLDSFVSLFGSIHVLHAPAAHLATRTGALLAGEAEFLLLTVKAGDDTPLGTKLPASICVQAAGGDRPISLCISPYRWTDGAQPVPLVTLPCADVSAFQVELLVGTVYRVDVCVAAGVGDEAEPLEELASALPPSTIQEEEEKEERDGEEGAGTGAAQGAAGCTAPEADVLHAADCLPPVLPLRPGFYSVCVGSASPVRMGDVDTIAREELSLHVHTVSGRTRPVDAGAWGAVLAVRITPSAAGSVRATVRLPPDGIPLSHCRLHAIDLQTGRCTSFTGLSTGSMPFGEGSQGATLILDVKAPTGKAVPDLDWSATVMADTEVQVSALPLEEVALMGQPYVPNTAFRLFRSVVACPDGVAGAAVHVTCPGFPNVMLTLRQLRVDSEAEAAGKDRITSVIRSMSGVGCVTMLGLEPLAGEGSATEALIECVVGATCAISMLKLPTRPAATTQVAPFGQAGEGHVGQGEQEPGLVWTMRAVGPAGLSVKEDDSYEKSLAGLAASWEAAQGGRAAKAKAARGAYLAQREGADEVGDEKNGKRGQGGEEPAAAGGKSVGVIEAGRGGDEAAGAVEVLGAVVTIRVGAGAEARLLSDEERQADADRLKLDVEQAKAGLANSEARRLALVDSAAAAGVTQLRAAKAARDAAAQAAAVCSIKCGELVAAMLPPPLAPVEPESSKGKRGKK
jgi:hypothetical protein